jgi:multidrug resistance protein, MATE family
MRAALQRWFDPARSRELLTLAGPIIAGMASQTVFNLVDTAMVGDLGPAPQAAAGLGSFTFLVLAYLVVGVGTGVQAVAARRDGEEDKEAAGASLDTGLVLAVLVGLPLGYGLAQLAPTIFGHLSDDPKVVADGSGYLAIRLMGLGAVAANYCFRGFYNGVGRSRVYMTSIVLIHVSNVFLNWVFIYGNLGARPMGVKGAALASVLAAVFGVCFYTTLTLVQGDIRSVFKPFRFSSLRASRFARMLSLSWPEAVRGVLTLFGFLLFLELHEAFGTREAAAGTILINVASAGFLPAFGMGLACATLVGRHLGRGQPEEARAMVWLGARLAAAGLLVPCLLVGIFAPQVLGLFTPDAPVVETATSALRLYAFTGPADAIPVVLVFSMFGAGATRWVAGVQVTQQYALLLPLAWLFGFALNLGVLGLWIGLVLSRIGMAWFGVRRIRGDRWASIDV